MEEWTPAGGVDSTSATRSRVAGTIVVDVTFLEMNSVFFTTNLLETVETRPLIDIDYQSRCALIAGTIPRIFVIGHVVCYPSPSRLCLFLSFSQLHSNPSSSPPLTAATMRPGTAMPTGYSFASTGSNFSIRASCHNQIRVSFAPCSHLNEIRT